MGRVIQLPKRDEAAVLEYLDYRRIPETLELCDRFPNGYDDRPTAADVDFVRRWCNEMLEKIHGGYERGLIDAETFLRLTTKRDIPFDERQAMRERQGYYEPEEAGMLDDGRKVCLVNTDQGWVQVTLEPEGWTVYTPPDAG